MQRTAWAVLGITGLSVLMCAGNGGVARAQTPEPGTPPRGQATPRSAGVSAGQGQTDVPAQAGTGQATRPALTEDEAAELTRLRAEVVRLRQEVAGLRAQATSGAQATTAGQGGSGNATTSAGAGQGQASASKAGGQTPTSGASGTGQVASGTGGASGTGQVASGTGGASGTGQAVSDVPPSGSAVTMPQGIAVVDAVYTGVVRSVSSHEVVIAAQGGSRVALPVRSDTKVQREGKRIPVGQLKKGEFVRAVVDMMDKSDTLEISVQPAPAPR